jgi:hypothetical protein
MPEDSESAPAAPELPSADWAAPPTEMVRNAHVAQVMWGAAVLDNPLVTLLVHSLPNLSRRLRERLFEGYGPLGNFALRFFFDRVQDCLRGLWQLIDKLANEKGIKIEPPAWPPGR